MDRTLGRDAFHFVLLLLAAFAPSCAGAPPKKDNSLTVQQYEQNSPPPPDPCVGEKGDPLECTSQADCCKGYACTKDPERNPRALYCLKE